MGGPAAQSGRHPKAQDITTLLQAWGQGEESALKRLIPLVYKEFRKIAHRRMAGERKGHTLQTTALVNEAYLKLIDFRKVNWQDRVHFFAISAQVMRHILVDPARFRGYQKRGGEAHKVTLDENLPGPISRDQGLVALDDALKALAEMDERKSKVCGVALLRRTQRGGTRGGARSLPAHGPARLGVRQILAAAGNGKERRG